MSDDGLLNVKLVAPKELGGIGGAINPEQLFAAGYLACFMGATKHVAGIKEISVPDAAYNKECVYIGPTPAGFVIATWLLIISPSMDR